MVKEEPASDPSLKLDNRKIQIQVDDEHSAVAFAYFHRPMRTGLQQKPAMVTQWLDVLLQQPSFSNGMELTTEEQEFLIVSQPCLALPNPPAHVEEEQVNKEFHPFEPVQFAGHG